MNAPVKCRASVSDIEEFRQYLDDEEYRTEDLIARLRRQTPQTEAMLAGVALHEWLETQAHHVGSAKVVEHGGFKFDFSEGEFQVPVSGFSELKCEKWYGSLLVRGRVDVIDGNAVEDWKTTSHFDLERFMEGYQWRYYLDMMGAAVFRWRVFELRERAPRDYVVKAIHQPIEQFAYPEMGDDCLALAKMYHDFAVTHLPERILK